MVDPPQVLRFGQSDADLSGAPSEVAPFDADDLCPSGLFQGGDVEDEPLPDAGRVISGKLRAVKIGVDDDGVLSGGCDTAD
jgi:hypothetical protein